MKDQFDLERFVEAQNPVLESVLSELREGCKREHWMWFVFPQFKGLGKSLDATFFAISARSEVEAYLNHPILCQRLLDCTELVISTEGRLIEEIFGGIDSIKFRSCMTLFDEVRPDIKVFGRALDKYFNGERDPLTLLLLSKS